MNLDTRLDEQSDIALARPALTMLAETIDREFQRREPTQPTPYEWAAARLGVERNELVVLSEDVDTAIAHSIGRWLYDAQARWSSPTT